MAVAADAIFKLLLIGDSSVGKSSLLLRFTEDDFEEDQPCTIGIDFKVKLVDMAGKRINLTIWDTAGQEKFHSLTSSYYRGTHGIFVVYDVTNRASFEHVERWLKEITINATSQHVVRFLIANKTDATPRVVSRDEGVEFARRRQLLYMECSAKTKLGVHQAFEEMCEKILESPQLFDSARARGSGDSSNTVDAGAAVRSPEEIEAGYCC